MEEISLVDVHAHLEEVDDLAEALQEARASGVKAVVAVGSDRVSNRRVLEIAAEYPNYVYPALGYHPWVIEEDNVEENLSFLQDRIEECIALGEVGLDYKVKVRKELQRRVFDRILGLAVEHDKPLIIHCRLSHSRAFRMVAEKGVKRAVFHWYAGPLNVLGELLAKGYMISATPALQYSPPHQAAIKKAPLDQILLETDTPVAYGGKESRPRDVLLSLREVARLKELEPSVVSEQTTANATRFFGVSFP